MSVCVVAYCWRRILSDWLIRFWRMAGWQLTWLTTPRVRLNGLSIIWLIESL